MASNAEDELAAEQTEGFKVGEKKTIDEYQQLGETTSIHIAFDYLQTTVIRTYTTPV